MNKPRYVLTLSCRDRHGIIADVTTFLAGHCYNIEESSQFEDRLEQRFFMRSQFRAVDDKATDIDQVRRQFASLAAKDGMEWQLNNLDQRPKIVIAVSQWGHCLNALLHKWKEGTLPVEIAAVVSNHEHMRDLVNWYNLPYHHLPISRETKPEQEAKLYSIMEDSGADFLVLARYMQILSDNLCQKLQGRAINIHHSFLPGFKGAKPYHQAYDRGVKLIGATAHFVTSDLDEGPIIEQEVERVTHTNSPQELVEIGHDIESVVLCRAVRWHAERRVLINGHRTVVFRR
ncbi:MAG: formyltetrahydrofolate deformylase [Gammaproteobacteria bacterium]|uniref:formyltetrahydrofolate deformylase n=1 Tax=Pseudomaricurvus alcaniphilus TaxID=1166482 RepID=UPI00140B6422|nr:formyltetrahydrofolate deformylase [Pseudomaricurvus alcaniphilus]MBR9909132.1 formyltetrahydrofolate deformylase [Gammaproteobacteria bacterium]NHN38177.1 formyltetrahydrofolate deformylase [Pseudomaricurvus alcaniphilus]